MSKIKYIYRPILHIDIEIPFVRIHTAIMADKTITGYREYVALHIDIHKWHWRMDLYDTHRRIIERQQQ